MSANKHTPGPWSVGGSTGLVNQIAILPCIGVVYGAGDEIKANAALIAAAPDMLEALRAFIEWCDSEKAGPQYSSAERRNSATGEPEWRAWWENQLRLAALSPELARAALAKAGAP